MGLFGKLFAHKEKRYTLDEAMKIVESELSTRQRQDLDQSYMRATQMHHELQLLSKLIDEFSSKPAPDMGRSSEGVKERFCTLSKRQISSLGSPDKAKPQEFLREVGELMNSLGGLTQRQILHINFFFKEDFKSVGRKMKEISLLLSHDSRAPDHQKAVDMRRKINYLERQKEQAADAIKQLEEKLTQPKPALPEVPRHPDTHNLDAAESKLKSKKQEIDSFLSIQKVLKKYMYISESKDKILEAYVESPSSALLADENLSIIEHAAKASVMVNEGKIEADRKLEIVASSAPYLAKSRSELQELQERIAQAKKKYFEELESFESALKARTNMMAEQEGENKAAEKMLKAEKEELEHLEKEIASLRAELLMTVSRLLDAEVTL